MNATLVRNILSLTILGLVLAMGFSVSSAWAFGPCSECEFERVMCENGAETAFDFCVDECEGDPGCEADCDARYEQDLWMCDLEYENCLWNCEP